MMVKVVVVMIMIMFVFFGKEVFHMSEIVNKSNCQTHRYL
jgi:hypothetical protein